MNVTTDIKSRIKGALALQAILKKRRKLSAGQDINAGQDEIKNN
jgi:hypothetical protein